jgi:nucleoside phosphorylase
MRVDVLVVAALPEELSAAKAASLSGGPGLPGVARWEEHPSARYLLGDYRTTGGGGVSMALARPVEMGDRTTAPFVTSLVERLRPACVAMCGVCAGNPADTALGDVVVAEPVYKWDEGKLTPDGFVGDQRQFRLDQRWLREAQNLDPSTLPSHGTADADEALMWLLERLHRGHDPRTHPARGRYFPPGTWAERLDRWQVDGWITRAPDGTPRLAGTASDLVKRRLYDDVDGPRRLPFAVHVGPMASGSAVVADDGIWQRLATMGMRKIAAVEMEAATIATIAHAGDVPRWLVAKGVMDHANDDKDDRYKHFAARASAEVLFALLDRLATDLPPADLPPTDLPPAGRPRSASGDGPPATATTAPGGGGSLAPLEEVVSALLALPVILDPQQRRTVLSLLPDRISTLVPELPGARLHVVVLVRTCRRFPDGGRRLLDALRLADGHDSPGIDRVAAAIDDYWSAQSDS